MAALRRKRFLTLGDTFRDPTFDESAPKWIASYRGRTSRGLRDTTARTTLASWASGLASLKATYGDLAQRLRAAGRQGAQRERTGAEPDVFTHRRGPVRVRPSVRPQPPGSESGVFRSTVQKRPK
jgi:hypothetical protein